LRTLRFLPLVLVGLVKAVLVEVSPTLPPLLRVRPREAVGSALIGTLLNLSAPCEIPPKSGKGGVGDFEGHEGHIHGGDEHDSVKYFTWS